ncbi:MAG: hypothetical protein Q9162_002958 [Coniocarpon cinnabarinum]
MLKAQQNMSSTSPSGETDEGGKVKCLVNLLASRDSGEAFQGSKDPVDTLRPVPFDPFPYVKQRYSKHAWQSDSALSGGVDAAVDDEDLPSGPLPHVNLSYNEAERLIDAWRPQLAEHFPFAALYEGQSTQYLLVEMPFFATGIACAALYGDLKRQVEVSQSMIKDIGEKMLLEGEKSLDLLLGILVLLAWYHFHVFVNPQVSNLHHLCAALLVDLGLNRPPDRLFAQKWQLFSLQFVHGPNAHREMRSMVERRALAGCYYMSNVIWSTFKKMSSTPYSEHVEEAVEKLLCSRELPSDELLAYLVKCQRLMESVELGLGLNHPSADDSESAQHVLFFVSAFTTELKELRQKMPETVRENITMQLACLEVEALIYDIAFQNLHVLASHQKGDAHTRSVRRLEYLKLTLQSCKAFCDVLTTINPAEYYRHAFDTWARMCRILMVIARISSLPDLQNLTHELGSIIDFDNCTEAFAQKFERADECARALGHPMGENHVFKRWAWRLRTFQEGNRHTLHPDNLNYLASKAAFPGDDPVPDPSPVPTTSSTSVQTPSQDDAMNARFLASTTGPWDEDVAEYGNPTALCPMS